MTTKQFISLEKSLLLMFPDFVIKGSLMFIPPICPLLRGINFEGSSFDKASFYVTSFVMLLCRPTSHLYFNFGARVRLKEGGDRWDFAAPNVMNEVGAALNSQAMPFLSRVESLLGFLEFLKSCPINHRTLQANAFALARAGQIDEAIVVLDKLIQLNITVAWQRDVTDLARLLKSKLIEGPLASRHQLLSWEEESIRNLGLENEKGNE